jgi:wobble nucleotide-excising tRNase
VDIEALLNAARSLTGVEVETVAAALDRLRERRQTASRSVFNADKLATNDAVLPSVLACFEALATELARVERAIADVVAAMAAAYSTGLLELWKKGLELSPTGDQCPMCEADTLTPAKRAELAERLNDNAARFAKSAELGTAINAAKGRVVELTSRLDEFGGARISADEADQLSNLFGDRGPDLATFNEKAETFTRLGATIREKLAAATTFLNRCAADLEQAENAPRVVADARTINENIQQQSAAAAGAFPEYTEAWQAFSPKLYVLISSTEFVARIDAVGKTLRTEPSMRVLDQYDKVLKETQVLIRAVEQEMQTRQEHLLTTRGAEVKDLYDRLNRGADVLFEEMEPGTDTMRLHATSFGTRMSAAANLSECQLNCLGLAMWLMRATTPASPFGFVLLDDPVQSMDDDHTEAFISDIVPHLLDGCGKQVIVLSHVKRIAERLRDLNTTRPTKLYHYESYDRAGPSITEQVALKMLVAEIKGASRGNEQNRKYSVDRIRVLVEHFVRELYLNVNGAPVPPKYDQATAKDLLPVFQTITGATPQEHAGLRDTVKFCDPAHHTEVGYAVPIQSNIQPHIDRLEGLIKKYGM